MSLTKGPCDVGKQLSQHVLLMAPYARLKGDSFSEARLV